MDLPQSSDGSVDGSAAAVVARESVRVRKLRKPTPALNAARVIHRWVGLTLGILVLVSAVTGAIMAFRPQLDPLVYRSILVAPACGATLPLDQFAARARPLHTQSKLDYLRIRRDGDEPLIARFTDKETLYFNRCTGDLLGRQNRYDGVFGLPEKIHRMQFFENGNLVMGAGALAVCLVLVPMGLALWWPRAPRRLKDSLKPNVRLMGRAFEIDLHRTVGLYASAFLLVSTVTILPIAFPWVNDQLYRATGSEAEPKLKSASHAPSAKRISVEQAWRIIQSLTPGAQETLIHLPLKPDAPFESYIIGADAPHANARTMVYIDAYTGKVMRFTPYSQSSTGAKLYFWALSVHTGKVGGLLGQLLLFLGALSVPVLAYTGVSSYLRGRRARVRAASATRASPRRATA